MLPQHIQEQVVFTDACIATSSSSDMDGQRQFSDADEKFSKTPYFNFNDGKVKFDTNDVDNANENSGSASGLLPKFLLPDKQTSLRVSVCMLPT